MDLEMITLSKSEREKQTPYDITGITYTWNLKHDTSELCYKTNFQTENRFAAAMGGGWIGSLGFADANYYIDA